MVTDLFLQALSSSSSPDEDEAKTKNDNFVTMALRLTSSGEMAIPMGESCPWAAARQCCQWFTPYLYKKGSQMNVKLCHSHKISMRTCRSDGTPRRLFRCMSFTSTGSKPSECAVWATDWYYFRLPTIFHQQELVDSCFQLYKWCGFVWLLFCLCAMSQYENSTDVTSQIGRGGWPCKINSAWTGAHLNCDIAVHSMQINFG